VIEDAMNPILSRQGGRLPFAVNERDVDLLLIEQLHVSPGFVKKFAKLLSLEGAVVEDVQHSVYREHGETDVLLTVHHEGRRVAVMIEDKIGAPMQPDQCERYHLRGQALCATGAADAYRTVLCAPAGYIAGIPITEPWQKRVSFEDIAGIIIDEGFPGWEWREALLCGAAARQNRASAANDRASTQYDPVIAPLKLAYREYARLHFPQVKASVQTGKDREFFLGVAGLPAGIRFKHAFFAGEVSLIFERKWVETARIALAGKLPDDAWTVEFGSEFHVRLSTEVLDPDLAIEEQEHLVEAALEKVLRLGSFGELVAKSRT
jgi:hypothetical protein